MSIIEKAKAIRSEAWSALMASPQFTAFKASDDFVLALGGGTAMPSAFGPPVKANGGTSPTLKKAIPARHVEINAPKRVTQGDAAALALREAGEPMGIVPFMNGAEAKGAKLNGAKLPNFRSTISKDARFESVTRDGKYFWWFKGEPLPPSWNETADPDLLAESAGSSMHSSREGGEANATAT